MVLAGSATAGALADMPGLEGGSARSDVLTEPGSEIWLLQLAAGEREYQNNDFFLGCFNAEAV